MLGYPNFRIIGEPKLSHKTQKRPLNKGDSRHLELYIHRTKKTKKKGLTLLSLSYNLGVMKSSDLTRRQSVVLAFIRDFARKERRSPTLSEIAKGVRTHAVSTVHKHVQHLIEKGFLSRSQGKGNNIVVVVPHHTADYQDFRPSSSKFIPFCGDIAAGSPLIPESRSIPLEVPNTIHRNKEDLFILRVKGDSMIQDAVLDGDFVILQKNSEYRNGDRVVALIDGEEATLKEFKKDANGITLIPHNSDLAPILYQEDRIEIQGKLVGVMRSL